MKKFKKMGISLLVITGVCLAGSSIYLKNDKIKAEDVKTCDTAAAELKSPFGDISDNRIRFAYLGIDPEVFEIEKSECKEVSSLLNSFDWKEIPLDSPRGDGESFTIYVYDGKDSFELIFYPQYKNIEFISENEHKKYEGISDESYYELFSMAMDIDFKRTPFWSCNKEEAIQGNKVNVNYYLAWEDVLTEEGIKTNL